MTVLAGKFEVHFAPISNQSIDITFGATKAKVTQGDELITIIDNKYVSDMVRRIKEIDENVNIEVR